MKRLMLLRHAKSDWSAPYLSDHDRPLNKRGRTTAGMLGKWFLQQGVEPDLVLCSTATRTRETLSLLEKEANLQSAISYEPHLYGASTGTMLSLLRKNGGHADCILMIGHNPGIEQFALCLTQHDEENLLPLIHIKVPTGSLITLDFDIQTFADLQENSGYLRQFLRPKHELQHET